MVGLLYSLGLCCGIYCSRRTGNHAKGQFCGLYNRRLPAFGAILVAGSFPVTKEHYTNVSKALARLPVPPLQYILKENRVETMTTGFDVTVFFVCFLPSSKNPPVSTTTTTGLFSVSTIAVTMSTPFRR
ncbi:hypothetical protein IW261DRAFT_1564474 [Armillaria novae-zelandiae]|uniref:Uncharacterized protein n=1 Tax=Armillaria novae-zelandiae TaxID=153914 RepID=A0AA39P908_9AGAR|nr:hypothetical protein IW261DRAFT_1564474 [Armillaria novae-zelandiae]